MSRLCLAAEDIGVLKLEELFVIHQLKEQGESIAAIARRTGLPEFDTNTQDESILLVWVSTRYQ